MTTLIPQTKSVVSALTAAKFQVGQAGAAWAECVLDPLNQDGRELIDESMSFIPDGDGSDRVLLKLTGLGNISGGTATSGIIQLAGLRKIADASTYTYDLDATYGGNPFSDENMTGRHGSAYASEHATMNALAPLMTQWRPIAAGLNITVSSDPTTSAGQLQAYHSDVPLAYYHLTGTTASTEYNATTAICTTKVGRVYTASEGISVRQPVTGETLEWQNNDFNEGSIDAGDTLPHGSAPTVIYSGLTGGTQLTIRWVYYLEAKMRGGLPFLHGKGPAEANFLGLRGWVNSFPLVSSGHSFSGFLEKIAPAMPAIGTILGGAAGYPTGGMYAGTLLGNAMTTLPRLFKSKSKPSAKSLTAAQTIPVPVVLNPVKRRTPTNVPKIVTKIVPLPRRRNRRRRIVPMQDIERALGRLHM